MVCCAPSGSPPNVGLMRFIIDESHLKEVNTYHFLSVFAYSFSYSCPHSDCTGLPKLNHVWRERVIEGEMKRGSLTLVAVFVPPLHVFFSPSQPA